MLWLAGWLIGWRGGWAFCVPFLWARERKEREKRKKKLSKKSYEYNICIDGYHPHIYSKKPAHCRAGYLSMFGQGSPHVIDSVSMHRMIHVQPRQSP